MKKCGVKITPVDTWFFRDSTPFSTEVNSAVDPKGLFPPPPSTTAGTIRAGLALTSRYKQKRWNGKDSWPEEFKEVLGDGPYNFGKLEIVGPIVLECDRPLWPAPKHLCSRENGVVDSSDRPSLALLEPGSKVLCDLGDVSLPQLPQSIPDPQRWDVLSDRWLTTEQLQSIALGDLAANKNLFKPEGLKKPKDLWKEEVRIGIQINHEKRTVDEGKLYTAHHVRLEKNVSLGFLIRGLPRDWGSEFLNAGCDENSQKQTGRTLVLPVGGEGRLGIWESWKADIGFTIPQQTILETGQFALVFLTPADLPKEVIRGEQCIEELAGARVFCACCDRPQRIGGWNSLNKEPLPLKSYLAAGSVLFCKVEDTERLAELLNQLEQQDHFPGRGLVRVGRRTQAGFGLATLGIVPKDCVA